MSMSTNKSFFIIGADHTGITVSNLERSLEFWRDVLGFELSHTAHQTGELAREITGVAGAELKLAVLKAPGGHKIELLEYRKLFNRARMLENASSTYAILMERRSSSCSRRIKAVDG
jgi:hypothetical protein